MVSVLWDTQIDDRDAIVHYRLGNRHYFSCMRVFLNNCKIYAILHPCYRWYLWDFLRTQTSPSVSLFLRLVYSNQCAALQFAPDPHDFCGCGDWTQMTQRGERKLSQSDHSCVTIKHRSALCFQALLQLQWVTQILCLKPITQNVSWKFPSSFPPLLPGGGHRAGSGQGSLWRLIWKVPKRENSTGTTHSHL